MFGSFDRAATQRGFQVYREVCSACHGVKYMAFRNLAALGYAEDQIKAIAAEYTITDGPNDEGEMFERAGLPFDRIPGPYPNDAAAAAANGGKAPPDLSLMAKARMGGEDYLYSLLTGYEDPPADFEVPEGGYYNAYFPGHVIAMPPPLERRPGHLRRRHQRDRLADVPGRQPVPDVGGGAEARGAQGDRAEGDPVPGRADRA